MFISVSITLIFSGVPMYIFSNEIWGVIDKIGALATALALFAAMYQSYVAWTAAKASNQSNAQNLFQQKFNLIIEQHNNALKDVKSWLPNPPVNINTSTIDYVKYIRGNENISPYMRILYHTLKTIREELPVSNKVSQADRILSQKKYTSLVRSFIPNSILYLVAANSSIINNKFIELDGSENYSYYHKMIIEFDFLEHLAMDNSRALNLQDKINEICELTYNSCLGYYANSAGIILDGQEKNAHIKKLKLLLNDINTFICISFNLKDKSVIVSDSNIGTSTLSEMALRFFYESQLKLSVEIFEKFVGDEVGKGIVENINYIVNNANWFNDMNLYNATGGFYNTYPISNYLIENVSFNFSTQKLYAFRDGFYEKLTIMLREQSSHRRDIYYYEKSIKKAADKIFDDVNNLISRLATLKLKIESDLTPEEILKIHKGNLELEFQKIFN
ncbi:hypothetical protein [Pantoea dispersa]|uniref:hypothetical protein n=1 Tax=Pantoea dispersa TaxID=59814 RepID=UPI00187C22D2|nr:hypothetical protein [Pantoea dispersa]